jgi:hypothetical protein
MPLNNTAPFQPMPILWSCRPENPMESLITNDVPNLSDAHNFKKHFLFYFFATFLAQSAYVPR